MNDLQRTISVSSPHCGAVSHVHVRRDVPKVVEVQGLGCRRGHIPSKSRVTLYIGEVAASSAPIVLDTLLGSCVAVCLYDPMLRAGGMNHILVSKCRPGDQSPRCGIHAMELLINELMKLGGDRRRFVAKAFGGATVLGGLKLPLVGEANSRFVRDFLTTEKIPLVAERLGGSHAVHLHFTTDTGKVTVRTVDGSRLPKIINTEREYTRTPFPNVSFAGEITLF